MSKYARGHAAWGICGRSSIKMLLKDMVFDGRYPNMRVHPDWFEPKDPLDYAPRVDDPIALWRPAPDNWHVTPPVLTLGDFGNTTASLTWTAATSDAEQIEYYSVYLRRVDVDEPWSLYVSIDVVRDMFGAITFEPLDDVVTLPVPGTLYEFMVSATDSGGLSGNSNVVQMTDGVVTLTDHDLKFGYTGTTSVVHARLDFDSGGDSGQLGMSLTQIPTTATLKLDNGTTVSYPPTNVIAIPGEWLVGAGVYEYRATPQGSAVITGTVTVVAAPDGAWHAIGVGTAVELQIRQEFGGGNYQRIWTVEIRRAGVTLATANINFHVGNTSF